MMQRMRIPLLVGVIVLILIAGASLVEGLRTPAAWSGDVCRQLANSHEETVRQARLASDPVQKAMLAAWEAEYRTQANELKCGFAVGATPSSTPSAAAPTQSASPSPSVDTEGWEPHYFTLDEGKISLRAFGPAINGNAEEVREEFARRMKADPALLCANGGLILDDQDGGVDCITSLLQSEQARDAYFGRMMDTIDTMEVETLQPQAVKSAYMVVGDDGIPRVLEWSTYRETAYRTLTVTTRSGDVVRFRLECGFQWDTGVPAKGKTGTPPKKPHNPAPECVAGEGRDEEANCKPPKSKPSPSPSTPTSEPTPTPTSEPTPTPKPTPTPSCAGKTCEQPVVAPSGRVKPTTEPTRNPESTRPSSSSQPATTATANIEAPGASAGPTQSASPVPSVSQPSAPIGGDPGDPDKG